MSKDVIQDQIENVITHIKQKLLEVKDSGQLKDIEVKFTGKKGEITNMMKLMKEIKQEERREFGQKINKLKDLAKELIDERRAMILKAEQKEKFEAEKIDVSLPGKKSDIGSFHPITKGYYEIRDIFLGLGFDIMEGPEIEYDKYNFEMLNIPKDHPARDMQDTFYVSDDIVLRTHTSPVQIRTMLKQKPPIRMICPGRVYRTDDVDATHSPVFNQIKIVLLTKKKIALPF